MVSSFTVRIAIKKTAMKIRNIMTVLNLNFTLQTNLYAKQYLSIEELHQESSQLLNQQNQKMH